MARYLTCIGRKIIFIVSLESKYEFAANPTTLIIFNYLVNMLIKCLYSFLYLVSHVASRNKIVWTAIVVMKICRNDRKKKRIV